MVHDQSLSFQRYELTNIVCFNGVTDSEENAHMGLFVHDFFAHKKLISSFIINLMRSFNRTLVEYTFFDV